jgi:proteasome lid subunit RPN8/RPN11
MGKVYHPDFFRRPAKPFSRAILRDAANHACQVAPNESCGLVCDGQYVPCTNVADEPSQEFVIAPEELAIAYATGTLEGIIHSHPGGPWWPSRADMVGQIETGVPWAILVPGEDEAQLACWWGAERPPVMTQEGLHVPRAFLHGVSDCYSLCQDFYRETAGLELPDVARDWEWWLEPDRYGNLYIDNLSAQGFEIIATDPQTYAEIAQPGDAYLMAIRSKVPNHAGIYLGDGLLLEHMHGNLSHREPIARKLKHITHWLRHKG